MVILLTALFVIMLSVNKRKASLISTNIRYESLRREKQRFFEAVKAAQKVTIETIPMPIDLAPPPAPLLPPPLPNLETKEEERGKKDHSKSEKTDCIPLPVGEAATRQSKGPIMMGTF